MVPCLLWLAELCLAHQTHQTLLGAFVLHTKAPLALEYSDVQPSTLLSRRLSVLHSDLMTP